MAGSYGQAPYGQTPYGQGPSGQGPYVQQPYAQNPYAQNPYVQNPYAQNPYAPAPYGTAWGAPPWKGAHLGRPPAGPGALAEPGRRLAARALDLLLMVPVFAALLAVALAIFASRFGPIFPDFPNVGNDVPAPTPTPGIVWVYLTVAVCLFLTGVVLLVYETVAVAKYERTFGMAWLHVRPLRVDGSAISWGRAFVRALIFWLAGVVGWIGLLDPLWCLWDGERQCLHDKVADTIVVNDTPAPPTASQ
jgi:uncharacterized RDD family membrane protein YckC